MTDTDRHALIQADLERFAVLQATLGRSSTFEVASDAGFVSFDGIRVVDVTRRYRIRRAARARKARRGWR